MAVEIGKVRVRAGEHIVHFYEDDSQLAGTVGAYLIQAVGDGAVAIVIATPAHHRQFASELDAAGIDPAQAAREGVLIRLDAADTLAGFTEAGEVDHAAFRRNVGSVLRQATETGRPVLAYGEMVALLWEAGDVLAAVELEKAWNGLADEVAFGLICAYRSESVQGHEHAEALRAVCHLHSSVVDAPEDAEPEEPGACAHFAPERESATAARHFVADVLGRWGKPAALLEDAKLIVTELASNAIIHARSPFSVELRPHGASVRIAVRDASPARPIVKDTGMEASGRGMRLVDLLTADWGVEFGGHGKTVWAELRA
jgi:anti-sigma regulatory factor (Ser/Thr protein kinase)